MKFTALFKKIGPGFITGAADDDPSGVASYAQAGAVHGTGMLWIALYFFPLLVSIQEIAARIGIVSGKGIIKNLKEHYSFALAAAITVLLVIANTINLGADLSAIAAGIQLIYPFPLWETILAVAAIIIILLVSLSYKQYFGILKIFALFLFAYVITGFFVIEDWGSLLWATIIPQKFEWSKEYIWLLIGLMGTTISPYMMLWQANEEVEEEKVAHISPRNATSPRIPGLLKKMRRDTLFGMGFSELITWFIIAVTASTLFVGGATSIETAAQAAASLEPFSGRYASLLFAFGFIGTGFLAIPIFAASNASAISELFGFKEGLYKRIMQAPVFYMTIAVSTLCGVLLNRVGVDPIEALIFAAVANGIISLPLIVVLLAMGKNKNIVGVYKTGILGDVLTKATIAFLSLLLVTLLIFTIL